jgi:hypothetical protein
LTASEIFCLHPMYPFGRLHRRVTKEKLNLFELASSAMAVADASATKIVGYTGWSMPIIWLLCYMCYK